MEQGCKHQIVQECPACQEFRFFFFSAWLGAFLLVHSFCRHFSEQPRDGFLDSTLVAAHGSMEPVVSIAKLGYRGRRAAKFKKFKKRAKHGSGNPKIFNPYTKLSWESQGRASIRHMRANQFPQFALC